MNVVKKGVLECVIIAQHGGKKGDADVKADGSKNKKQTNRRIGSIFTNIGRKEGTTSVTMPLRAAFSISISIFELEVPRHCTSSSLLTLSFWPVG